MRGPGMSLGIGASARRRDQGLDAAALHPPVHLEGALHELFGDVSEISFGVATITWPDWRSADLVAIGLSLAAGLALLHWRVNLVKVLLASGAVGYLAHATIG